MHRFVLTVVLATGWALPAYAQRTSENVIRAAEDAFGLSVGNERLGLYADNNVRGFSPAASGNLRLDGLYFDRRATVSPRLIRSSTVRVGLTAQGYDFPAPSGIVDYALRLPTGRQTTSTVLTGDSWGRMSMELDTDLRVTDRVALGMGVSRGLEELNYGANRDVLSGTMIVNWRPSAEVQVVPFVSWTSYANEEAPPRVFTAGDFIPPEISPRRFYGQDWTDGETVAWNYGVLASGQLGDRTTLRAGLFRSSGIQDRGFFDQFVRTDRDGRATETATSLPRQEFSSTSGEIRLVRTFDDGPRRHSLLATVRGRQRFTASGGGGSVTLGPAQIGVPTERPEPVFVLGSPTLDRVRQQTLGASYQGVWRERGELNFGLQRTRYRRHLSLLAGDAASDEGYWLFNVNSAAYLAPGLSAFGGYTRGLEDGGFAPQNAANANSALPANVTEQAEIGGRATFGPTRVVGGVFRIEKPYYALDPQGVFSPIGRVRSTGIETSLITSLPGGLRMVGGLVLTWPRVDDPTRNADYKPIGSVGTTARLSADYSPPAASAWSFDGSISHSGARVARTASALRLPSRTTIDLGARYRFKAAGHPTVLRAVVYNVGDVRGWTVDSGGGFSPEDPRRFVVNLYTDF